MRGPPRELQVKLNVDPLKEFSICGDIKTLPAGETRKMKKINESIVVLNFDEIIKKNFMTYH